MFKRGFPYSNAHDLNLDWIIQKIEQYDQDLHSKHPSYTIEDGSVIVQDQDGTELYRVEIKAEGIFIMQNGVPVAGYNANSGTWGMVDAWTENVRVEQDISVGGSVWAPEMAINRNEYPALEFRNNEGDVYYGYLMYDHTTHQAFIRCVTSDGSHYESFALPAPNLAATANSFYSVLTSKAAVTIAQGGTGATSAADARTALGAVNIAGDAMTGDLSTTKLTIKRATYPTLAFNDSSNTNLGYMMVDHTTRRVYLRSTMSDAEHYDSFSLPLPDLTRTSNKFWEILTTKAPVTIAQGGTGMSAPEAAASLTWHTDITTVANETHLYKFGSVGVLSAKFTSSASIANASDILTIPTGYEPKVAMNFVAHVYNGSAYYSMILGTDNFIHNRSALPAGTYTIDLTYIIK